MITNTSLTHPFAVDEVRVVWGSFSLNSKILGIVTFSLRWARDKYETNLLVKVGMIASETSNKWNSWGDTKSGITIFALNLNGLMDACHVRCQHETRLNIIFFAGGRWWRWLYDSDDARRLHPWHLLWREFMAVYTKIHLDARSGLIIKRRHRPLKMFCCFILRIKDSWHEQTTTITVYMTRRVQMVSFTLWI